MLSCCCCWVTKLCPTLCDTMDCSIPGFPVLHHLPKFAQTHVHWIVMLIISSSIIPFSSCPQSFPASGSFPMSQFFTSGGQSIVASASASVSRSNEYSGLISFRIDWFDLLAVQGTLKSILQHYNLKASVLQCSAFFMVQLSYPYVTTGKTIALKMWTLLRFFTQPKSK